MTQLEATTAPAQGEPAAASPAPPPSFEASLDASIEQARQQAMAEVDTTDDGAALDPQADGEVATSEEPAAEPDAALEPDAYEQLLENDPEFSQLSRSQKGKLLKAFQARADDAAQKAEQAQAEAEELRQRAEQQTAHTRELASKLTNFIGTDEQLKDLKEKGLDGDWNAAAQFKELEARREYQDLFEAIAFGKIGVHLETVAKEAAGLDPADIRAAKGFPDALTRVVKGVEKRLSDKYEGQLKELKTQLDAEKAAHEGTRVKVTGNRPGAETGGRSAVGGPLAPYLDPKTGYMTDEGLEAALDGKLAGLRLNE